MEENYILDMLQFALQILLCLAPSSIFKYFCQLQVNEERTLTRTVSTITLYKLCAVWARMCSTNQAHHYLDMTIQTDVKAHARIQQLKVRYHLIQQDIFQIKQKIQNLLFSVKISVCGYIFMNAHFSYNFKVKCLFIKLHSYIMSDKAEPFDLLQLFSLLQLSSYFSPRPMRLPTMAKAQHPSFIVPHLWDFNSM